MVFERMEGEDKEACLFEGELVIGVVSVPMSVGVPMPMGHI